MLQPGDKILTMSLQDGGHLTHGTPKIGMLYEVINYGVDPQSGRIDYVPLDNWPNGKSQNDHGWGIRLFADDRFRKNGKNRQGEWCLITC